MTLTRTLREELAHLNWPEPTQRLTLARAMVHLGGRWHVRAQTQEMVVRCAYGAVARRLRHYLVNDLGSRPDISRHMGTNLAHSGGWLVSVGPQELDALGFTPNPTPGEAPLAPTLAMVDTTTLPAFLAGAIMVAGSLSAPHAPVHFELSTPDVETATWICTQLGWPDPHEERIVIKNGALVERLLSTLGSVHTYATFKEGREILALRKTANRTANADRANLARTTEAAAKQIQAIEKIVEYTGWAGFPEALRPLALARVASPEASLAELGALMIPPVDKATVHRRLKRILDLAVPLE